MKPNNIHPKSQHKALLGLGIFMCVAIIGLLIFKEYLHSRPPKLYNKKIVVQAKPGLLESSSDVASKIQIKDSADPHCFFRHYLTTTGQLSETIQPDDSYITVDAIPESCQGLENKSIPIAQFNSASSSTSKSSEIKQQLNKVSQCTNRCQQWSLYTATFRHKSASGVTFYILVSGAKDSPFEHTNVSDSTVLSTAQYIRQLLDAGQL